MGANSVLNAFRRRVLGRREEETYNIPLNPRPEQHVQLVVHLANENQPLRLEYRPDQTVRDVCEEIAKKLNILPLALPFFTLVSKQEGHCLNQQKKLSKIEWGQEYDFKLAFKACRASRFKQPDINDVNVIKYLFHQSRQEFLKGSITFSEEEENNKYLVKLVILELTYQSRQLHIKPQKLVDNAKQYKVLDLLRRGIFQQYDIKKVKEYIKSHLAKFQHLSDEDLMSDYLHVAEKSEMFFVYTFTVYKQFRANGRNHNVEYELFISPQFGIKKKEAGQSSQVPEVIVKDFSQVCGLEVDQTQCDQIIISRMESKAEVLSASSPQDAQSIVAIINGYYRLLVNRYRNLNGLTIMPKFHGPISRQMSMSILQAKGEDDGLFLIRQSRKVFGWHVLSLMYDKGIKHFEIIRDDNGLFILKDTTIKRQFKTLDAFVKHYKENKDGLLVCLKNICLPSETANDALLNSYPIAPVAPRPQDLIQFGLESIEAKDIKLLSAIGKAGEFGNVILSEWFEKEGENPRKIAVRKLKKKTYNKSFFEVEKKLIQMRNINIIPNYGFTQLKDSVGMVTEYASENLETYLKNAVSSQPERKGISKKSVILFAAQIAEGMMYLKNMGCVHGRLKAHNVLLASAEQIKISDIGLIDLQDHDGEFMDVDHASVGYCWHALEMLADPNSKATHESDVWSLGVTMWEMFALKRPFHSSTSCKPLPCKEILKRYHRGQYLSTQRENLPEAVALVIQKCWKPREEERISFVSIVTALRDLVFNASSQQSVSYSHKLILEQKTEDWEKPIKEEKQLPIEPLKLITAGDSYSMVATSKDYNHCTSNHNSTQGRKTSLQRTFSDPGSPKHLYEEPINENLLTLPQRKVSLTRTSSYPQSKHFTPSKEEMVLTGEGVKKKPRSFTQQAADCTPYETSAFVSTSRNMSKEVANNNDNQVMIESCLESHGEDKVMEFLKTELSKVSLKPEHLGVGDQQDYKESNEQKENQDSAMDFLGEIMRQKKPGRNPLQLPQSGSSTTGQYVPCPGVANPLQSGSSTTGQYVPCPGVANPSQSGNSTTGEYVPCPGVANPLHSGSSTSSQYVPCPGVANPLHSGSSTSSQYVPCPGVANPLHSGSSTSSQYVPCPGVANPLHSGSSTSSQYVPCPGVANPSQSGSSTSSQYVPCPGVANPSQSGNSTTGQYVPCPGVANPSQSGNSTTGQYVPCPGVANPLQSGNSTTGQYVPCPGVANPLQSGNSTTGQYVPCPGVANPLQSGTSTTGQYVPCPGVANPLHSGSSTSSQYVPCPGVANPSQSGNSTTGQYVPCPGVANPLQSGSSTNGQYVPPPGVANPLQSGSSTSGQYVPCPGVANPLQSGSSTNGQYVPPPGVANPLQSGSSTNGQYVPPPGVANFLQSDDSTSSLSEKKFFLEQGLKDFISFHLLKDKDATESPSSDHSKSGCVAGTQIHGHENLGYMQERALSGERAKGSSKTSDGISGGWFCDVETAQCSEGYVQVPINTTSPLQEHPGEHEPVCEDSSTSTKKLDSPPIEINQDPFLERAEAPTLTKQDNHDEEEMRRSRLEELKEKIHEDFRIEKANLRTTKEIGRGNFGIVRQGTLTKYNKQVPQKMDVAVKQLKKCPDEKSQDDFITEAINMQELRKIKNSHIVTPIGICLDTDSEDFMIVTELAPLGDLPKYLKEKKERIGVHKLLEFCLQIAEGMTSLEKESVLHRDLALRNILVAAEDQVKISDFGLSRLSEYYKARDGKWPMKWYAPESLEYKKFTTKSDVWSYGITVWEMFNYGELKPYPDVDNSKILDYILKGNRLGQPENCPDGVYEIMKQCWDEDCTKRPSFFFLHDTLIPKEIEKLTADETIN